MTLKRLLPVVAVLVLLAATAFWLWLRGDAASTGSAIEASATLTGEAAPGLMLEAVTLEESRRSPQPAEGEEIRARLIYLKTGQAPIDELIELWIGTQCPTANPEGKPGSPKACVQQWLDECLKPDAEAASPVTRCLYQAELKPVVNAYGLLTLELPGEQVRDAAHGATTTAYLNIDTETGDPLRLQNLVRIKPAKLQGLLEQKLRELYGIPPEKALNEGGLTIENTLPVPEAVLIERDGLRFTWQADEIAPGAADTPSVVIPYAELKKWIPDNSPLKRLPAAR